MMTFITFITSSIELAHTYDKQIVYSANNSTKINRSGMLRKSEPRSQAQAIGHIEHGN